MKLTFGKHKGLDLEYVVLTDPGYIVWMLRVEEPSHDLERALYDLRQLLKIFDEKPFEKRCTNSHCDNNASFCSIYPPHRDLKYWCDCCSPASLGASLSKLRIIRTYHDALAEGGAFCSGDNEYAVKHLIMTLAQAKGLPSNATSEEAVRFFNVHPTSGSR